MDDRVIKAAMDSFENDNLVAARELIQGQVRQARNDFIKAKLGLKNDIENQFVQPEPDATYTDIKGNEEPKPYKDMVDADDEYTPPDVKPKRRTTKKK
jgi:hypothetical protein